MGTKTSMGIRIHAEFYIEGNSNKHYTMININQWDTNTNRYGGELPREVIVGLAKIVMPYVVKIVGYNKKTLTQKDIDHLANWVAQ